MKHKSIKRIVTLSFLAVLVICVQANSKVSEPPQETELLIHYTVEYFNCKSDSEEYLALISETLKTAEKETKKNFLKLLLTYENEYKEKTDILYNKIFLSGNNDPQTSSIDSEENEQKEEDKAINIMLFHMHMNSD